MVWEDFYVLFSQLCLGSRELIEYFWHLPSTDVEGHCTVRNSNPFDSALLFAVLFLPTLALNAS